ncbi:MAG TPA: sigma factor-like helix-turn-helix DNA-binding protein [Thermoleophilaceae bacterium]|nr:sigma factor-like helix-turn-helix DNA-binding protein [Thermoleophilaceae bacterium]
MTEVESSAVTAPSAASEAESRAELAETVADIRELPERQGHALVMRELSALSYADSALVLSTSQAAARQLVHQARSVLHDRRSGRDMGCEAVRRAISERDGKAPCDRRLRAHLATCPDCRGFRASIDRRRSALAALAPPLAPAVAGDILGRLLDQGSGSGTSLAAGGGAAGGLAKLAGASSGAKLAAAAAAGALAVAARGGVLAAEGVLEGRDGARGAPAVPSSLAEMPEFRALRPAHRRGGEVRDGRDGASPAPTAPAEDLGPLAAFRPRGAARSHARPAWTSPTAAAPERPGCLRPVG